MVYWMVSLPSGSTEEEMARTWGQLHQMTEIDNKYSRNQRLHIPKLRVGTLDTLMTLSDELGKTSAQMEGIVSKLRRQIMEIRRGDGSDSGGGSQQLSVDGRSVEDYLFGFRWEEEKYPLNRPLKDNTEKIQETIGKLEDDLKVRLGEYTQIKGIISAATRKTTGSLAVRDLSGIVKPEHIFVSDYMTTVLVVISKFGVKDFMSNYEKMSEFVLPRSARVIDEDNEYALVSVIMFKKKVDNFRHTARSKGYQVRDFALNVEEQARQGEELEKVKEDLDVKKHQLEEWCQTAYGEAFSCWIHTCVIRLFVESILRYGLPPSFVAGMMLPEEKKVKKLKGVLESTFGDVTWQAIKDDVNVSGVLGPSGADDSLPYVCYIINVDG